MAEEVVWTKGEMFESARLAMMHPSEQSRGELPTAIRAKLALGLWAGHFLGLRNTSIAKMRSQRGPMHVPS